MPRSTKQDLELESSLVSESLEFLLSSLKLYFQWGLESLDSRSVKLRLARSVVRVFALAKSHLLTCSSLEFTSPILN